MIRSEERPEKTAGRFLLAAIVLLGTLAFPSAGRPETPGKTPPRIAWHKGPGTFDLGKELARIEIGKDQLFVGAEDARKLMELMGNPPSGQEIGLVLPASDNAGWFLLFEHFDVGYVKDDEKDRIDADALLKSIREATEEANKIRNKSGGSALKVLGWSEKPHYDAKSHNLVWATEAVTEGRESEPRNVNYNTRILGRQGYISAVLVADTATLAAAAPEVAALIGKLEYKKGKSYAEYVKGDKVAAYGLTALIAGGAGAAAAKMGLFGALGSFLGKAWKFVVAVVIAAGAGIRKLFAGRKDDGKIHPA